MPNVYFRWLLIFLKTRVDESANILFWLFSYVWRNFNCSFFLHSDVITNAFHQEWALFPKILHWSVQWLLQVQDVEEGFCLVLLDQQVYLQGKNCSLIHMTLKVYGNVAKIRSKIPKYLFTAISLSCCLFDSSNCFSSKPFAAYNSS